MELKEFFAEHHKVALAFSGGVDSAYLLYAAKDCGADVAAYFAKSQFQPAFEREDARSFAAELGIPLREIGLDVLQFDEVTANPENRCYFCKKRIMSAIGAAAAAEGYDQLIDGTNASDSGGDRPGMLVLEEEHILSPLRICGLTKSEVRERAREAGLFLWDKPAYACLATRIPAGERITGEKLRAVEESEEFLFSLGFSDFRVRLRDGGALLQFTAKQQEKARQLFPQIQAALAKNYDIVRLDPKAREESQ